MAIDQDELPFPAVHPVQRGVGGDAAFRVQPQVADQPVLLPGLAQGIVGRTDDQGAGQAVRHLFAALAVRMGMVPVGAGAPFGQGELVTAALAGGDGVLRVAILVGRHRQAVPVDGGGLVELIDELDVDFIPFRQLDQGTGQLAVVQPDLGLFAVRQDDVMAGGRQTRLETTGSRGGIGQRRQRAQRLPAGHAIRRHQGWVTRPHVHGHGSVVSHALGKGAPGQALQQAGAQRQFEKFASFHGFS